MEGSGVSDSLLNYPDGNFCAAFFTLKLGFRCTELFKFESVKNTSVRH